MTSPRNPSDPLDIIGIAAEDLAQELDDILRHPLAAGMSVERVQPPLADAVGMSEAVDLDLLEQLRVVRAILAADGDADIAHAGGSAARRPGRPRVSIGPSPVAASSSMVEDGRKEDAAPPRERNF